MKNSAGSIAWKAACAAVFFAAVANGQQTPRTGNPGVQVQVPPPSAPVEVKKPEAPAQPPPQAPPANPPGNPPQPPPPGPQTPGQPPAKPPKSGGSATPSDTPLTSVNPPLPNEATEEGGNVPPPPEPVPDELPEDGGHEVLMTIYMKGRGIESVFDEINKKSGIVVRAMENAAGQKVDLRVKDKTVRQILDELVVGKDLTWIKRADGTYEVWDKPSFIEKELRKRVIRRVFPLRFVNVTDVQPAVEGVKSDVGAIAGNPRTNELIVTDLPDKVALIESLLKEIDVQLYTRAFKIKYANFEDLQARLPDLKSPGGMIQVDAINRLILVTDTFEKIKQMEQIIELLDIDLPIKVYHLNSVGIEAEDALTMVEDIITPLASEDAVIEFNESQSTLLVKDVEEVHQRILEVLQFMDETPKQIWIEGEVMLVSRDYKFELGLEARYSGNLPRAIADGVIDALLPGGTETDFARNVGIFPAATSGAGGLHVMNLSGDLKVTMDALMSDDKTRILLQPRALVRNNEEVAINITQENPQGTTFQNTGFNNGTNNGTNGFIGSSIINVVTGLTLVLLPTINNRGLIEMELDFENSTPDERTIQIAGQPNTAIARNSQRIQTVLIIPSGETRVLGGLISRSNGNGQSGVPYLSKIPWIGWLFGRRTESESERNLLFFLTPTIVEEKPQIEIVDLSVNAAARALEPPDGATVEGEWSGQPLEINPIPEELMPYLRQTRPELPAPLEGGALIVPQETGDDDAATSPGLGAMAPPSGLPEYEIVEGMLLDTPSGIKTMAYEPLPFTGPGAELLSTSKGVSGPTGILSVSSQASGGGSGGGGRAPRAGAAAGAGAKSTRADLLAKAAAARGVRPQPGAPSPQLGGIAPPAGIQPQPVRNETR